MPANPFADIQMSVAGGGYVSGPQIVVGGASIQLRGSDTTGWKNPLWEIFEYPDGFALPAGWSNVNGVYRSNDEAPAVFNVDKIFNWGKYLFRLTAVESGLLDGVYHGRFDAQPLVAETGVIVLSPAGQHDSCFGEDRHFDAARQWVGELTKSLRALEGFTGMMTIDATPERIRRIPVADGDYRVVRAVIKAQSTDGSAAVLGEWEVKGGYARTAGVLAAAYAPTITTVYSTGGPGAPTITLNGNTDVDVNVTGVVATNVDWYMNELVL